LPIIPPIATAVRCRPLTWGGCIYEKLVNWIFQKKKKKKKKKKLTTDGPGGPRYESRISPIAVWAATIDPDTLKGH
jgi:hypothetical protein